MGNPKRHEGCWDSETFKSILDKSGIPYAKLADVLDVGLASITSYANGRAIPGLPIAIKMADYFGLPLDVFCGRLSEEEHEKVTKDFASNFMLLRKHDYEEARIRRKDIPYEYERYGKGNYIESPYPYSLLDDIVTGVGYGPDNKRYWDDILEPDQEAALKYLLSQLPDRVQTLIRLYYVESKTLEQCGNAVGLTRERVRQILARAVRQLRHPTRMKLLLYGLEGYEHFRANQNRRAVLEKEDEELDALEQEILERRQHLETILGEIPKTSEAERSAIGTLLEEMGLSVRSYNCLRRAGCETLYDVVQVIESGSLLGVRNLGRKSVNEVLDRVYSLTKKDYRSVVYADMEAG